MTPQEKLIYRTTLLETAVALGEPDRVPVVPMISGYPLTAYGCTYKQNMYEPESCIEAFLQFHRDFEPDVAFGNPCIYSGKALDLLEPKFMRYPGEKGGLADDALSYQFLEEGFPLIKENEWDEIINNKAGFILGKILPRQYKALEPLSGFDPSYLSMQVFMTLGQIGSPPVLEALEKLGQAVLETQKYMGSIMQLGMMLAQMGYPGIIGGSMACPFDLIGDMCLGAIDSMTMMLDEPEKLLELTERVTDDLVRICYGMAQQPHPIKYIWIFLHKGMDGFMNEEQYESFYFRPLMRVVQALTEGGLIPVLQCQGKYNTRLDYLAELPKGKCLCFFEDTDMDKVSEKLRGKICFAGNLSASQLAFGKPQEIADEVKRQIDTYGPGGGYIFSTGATVDIAKRENLEAMFDVALSYGKK